VVYTFEVNLTINPLKIIVNYKLNSVASLNNRGS